MMNADKMSSRFHGAKGTLLIVDDMPSSLRILVNCLHKLNFNVQVARDGEEALEQVACAPPELILLDVMMPNMDGHETCRRLKSNEATSGIPVIFMSAHSDPMDKVKCFEMGAVDYITKPFHHQEVLARVVTHLTLKRQEELLRASEANMEKLVCERTAALEEANRRLQREVAERKRSEKENYTLEGALSESETVLRSIIESANDAIISIDAKGYIISWNKAAEKIFGYKKEEVLHQSLTLVIPERYRDAHQKGIERLNLTEDTHVIGTTVELFGLNKEGIEFPLELSLAVCQTGTNKFYNGIIHDITERKKSEKRLQQINKTFECFVPKQFLSRLAKEGIENIELGKAETTAISILFSDIRSFTNFSENMPPQELLNLLNAYFKRMSEPIRAHHGFVDKFIGDAIMALFPENPENALQAVIEMERELTLYNEGRGRAGYDSIQAGFGLHYGTVTMGTVGSEDRMDTTVIGDAVNLTSRIESLTKVFKINILLSSAVYNQLLCPEDFKLREIDTVRVKGKQDPVILYEAFDNNAPHILEKKQHALPVFRQAMLHYKAGAFHDALELFRKCQELCPEDSIPSIYITRCHTLQRVPPRPDWAGVSTL